MAEVLNNTKKKEDLKTAWSEFITTGRILEDKVRPVILQSWNECVQDGINPYQKKITKVLTKEELQGLLQVNAELIEISTPIMENLALFVAGSGFTVTLANAQGIILKIIGDEDVRNAVKKGNFIEGADWSQASAGTNAIGTALKMGQPLQIFAYEHFCKCGHASTCSCAPIRNPQGEIIGALDMTGTYEKVHSHTLGMVVAAANAIENCLVMRQTQQDLELAHQYKNTIIDSISEGLVATDNKGRITHLNDIAKKILRLKNEQLECGEITSILPATNGRFFAMFSTGKYVTDEEFDIHTYSGTTKCTLTSRPIINNLGIKEGTLVIINEINRAKKIAQRMLGATAKMSFKNLIGRNKEFLDTIETGKLAASSSSNVLLLGESGTGKEVFAQAIHNDSYRRNGPFIAINCGAIPRDLIGSELFGYMEGAFTGAKRGGSPGKFELADEGTLFLDEIGEMPLELQTNLLRVLEQKSVIRIGGQEVIPVNVRIIAATNKDLLAEVGKGNFRQDLYYRLNVVNIRMIPLRERKEDIPLLVEYFYDNLVAKLEKTKYPINQEYINVLLKHNWPGNVRELQNVVERSVNLSRTGELEVNSLPIEAPRPVAEDYMAYPKGGLEDIEKEILLRLMQTYRGNISRVANELGIARTTLYRKLNKYKIDKEILL